MQIGDIVGKPGEKVRGRLVATYTTAQMPVEIPVTIVMGAKPGRTLVVTAALHGREMLGPLGLGKVLREIDPAEMSGNLIAVPCVNMSGFEFAQRNVLWDDADPNRQKAGKKDGTVTQQLVYHLFNEVIRKGDAHIDIHSSSSVGLVWYTIYHAEDGADAEVVRKSREMCLAFGLEQVMGKTPWHGTINEETVRVGIPAMTPEVGGGGDFYQNGRHQIDACARHSQRDEADGYSAGPHRNRIGQGDHLERPYGDQERRARGADAARSQAWRAAQRRRRLRDQVRSNYGR